MYTLILNGSPHEDGNTAELIGALRARLPGEVFEVRAYGGSIAACTDCGGCVGGPCVVADGMTEVYAAIERADAVVIASPVHFSQLTGMLICLCSRLQALWRAGQKKPRPKTKAGAVLLTGGGAGNHAPALAMADLVLGQMGARRVALVTSLRTDSLPASADTDAADAARSAAQALAACAARQNA